MVLQLPRAAEREYLAIYGIAAVYVAAVPSGHALVGCSRDLLHSLLALRRKYSGTHIRRQWSLAKMQKDCPNYGGAAEFLTSTLPQLR